MKKGKRKYVCSPIKCVICGYEFIPFSRKAMYCSDACKQLAYRRRLDSSSETEYETIPYSNEENLIDPNIWMENYMKKTNKHYLHEINETIFKSFPIEVQEFYFESWVLDKKYN